MTNAHSRRTSETVFAMIEPRVQPLRRRRAIFSARSSLVHDRIPNGRQNDAQNASTRSKENFWTRELSESSKWECTWGMERRCIHHKAHFFWRAGLRSTLCIYEIQRLPKLQVSVGWKSCGQMDHQGCHINDQEWRTNDHILRQLEWCYGPRSLDFYCADNEIFDVRRLGGENNPICQAVSGILC